MIIQIVFISKTQKFYKCIYIQIFTAKLNKIIQFYVMLVIYKKAIFLKKKQNLGKCFEIHET